MAPQNWGPTGWLSGFFVQGFLGSNTPGDISGMVVNHSFLLFS